ncbi:MAG: TetR/AcrR family transcriptional regulator [Neisseriaceae bacterium]|nr:TetR/AcrR family transcriptional regulator [Neisseriaceae bacterium]MBP6861061.1 TetR/AcrR family transcriptional regulator [Neisseriaceae bacterium]
MVKHNHAAAPVKHKPLGRPRTYDVDEALDRAIDVFCERGYSGASISALAQAMGLVTGSLYKAFKDKEALFMAALQRYNARNGRVTDGIVAAETSGMEKLRALLKLYVSASHSVEGLKGCLVVTSAVELTTFSAQVADRVEGCIEELKGLLMRIVRLGQRDGSINTSIEPEAAAVFILCHLQGLRVMGKLNPSAHELGLASDLVVTVLKP